MQLRGGGRDENKTGKIIPNNPVKIAGLMVCSIPFLAHAAKPLFSGGTSLKVAASISNYLSETILNKVNRSVPKQIKKIGGGPIFQRFR